MSFLDELNDFILDSEEVALDINLSDDDFKVCTFEQANYIARRIGILQKEKEEKIEIAKKEIERHKNQIDAFLEKHNQSIDNSINYLSMKLEAYAKQELEGKKARTVKLPFGNIGFKKQPQKFIYNDEDSLVEYLKEKNPEILSVKTKISLDKTKLKENITVVDGEAYLDGEKIDSVEVEPAKDVFRFTQSKQSS